eukprot:m.610803 g.610803  ORF g.610803 m.610803 type:complete len:521 (-) comp58132_c0_seq8:4310-5872(-)
MGKKQHQSDKMYITAKEWVEQYGGKKAASDAHKEFRRLAFDHCALSFREFETPVCTRDGVVYDLLSIVPFVKKYKVDPASGAPLDIKALIRLTFVKNADGKYHCPVTFKVFNENTFIVAIATSGNVYCMDAVQKLNIDAKNWKDLMTDQPFVRSDIIKIQDPANLEKFNMTNFYHLTHDLKVIEEETERAKSDPTFYLKGNASTVKDAMEELKATKDKWQLKSSLSSIDPDRVMEAAQDDDHKASYSTGQVSSSFTSTHMTVSTKNLAAKLDDDLVRYKKIKKVGYVQLQTTFGNLNIELRCELVPKTCENFLKHCAAGYYDNTIFHRSIRNFMIQGGDPTGTGTGGQSAFADGLPFPDEFKPNLLHEGRGVLSMANSGPNTNKSQFFITFRSCKHLDNKHTVFGKIVGGLDFLTDMEKVDTDSKDKPLKDIRIIKATVFQNPFQELEDQIKKEKELALKKAKEEAPVVPVAPTTYGTGVGKYLNLKALKAEADREQEPEENPSAKRPKVQQALSNFSSW